MFSIEVETLLVLGLVAICLIHFTTVGIQLLCVRAGAPSRGRQSTYGVGRRYSGPDGGS